MRALHLSILCVCVAALVACDPPPPPAPTPTEQSTSTPEISVTLPNFGLCWVAYSPTEYNPDVGGDVLLSTLKDDLRTLHDAGFRGIITYGATDALRRVPEAAREVGFTQVIMGIYNPLNAREISNALELGPLVDGYIVGSGGLGGKNERYQLDDLRNVIARVRNSTGKPTTTSEDIDDYFEIDGLLRLGDWIAPIAHPFKSTFKEPAKAAEWTEQKYKDLGRELDRAGTQKRTIQFKEVGMPTEGDPQVSEAKQAEFFTLLQQTQVPFVYFEAFDQPWKIERENFEWEGYWGLFHADKTPKPVVGAVCGRSSTTVSPTPIPTVAASATPEPASPTSSPENTVVPATRTTVPTTGTLAPATGTLAPPASPTASPEIPTEPPAPPTLEPSATPAPAAQTIAIYESALAAGYDLNIDNSGHVYGWLSNSNGVLEVDFLAGQQWAVVYITVGPPKPVGQRQQFVNLSRCTALHVDLRSEQEGVQVGLGMKDTEDPDNGLETLIPVTPGAEWQTYSVPLTEFVTADLNRIYLPFELVYRGGDAATVFVKNIRLTCEGPIT